jgi:hypothetical protein
MCRGTLIAFPTGYVPWHSHSFPNRICAMAHSQLSQPDMCLGLGAKDTAVVVHLEDTPVAHRTMVCSWWLWCYTFLTYADSFRNEGTLKQTGILNKRLYKICSNFFLHRVQILLTLELTRYVTQFITFLPNEHKTIYT